MPTKKVERGITRFDIDERNTHGFMMRICRRGKKIHEFFSDNAYGGKRKALLAARDRYQQLVKQLPDADSAKGKMSVRNTTGVVGVHVAHTVLTDCPDREYFAYCASWKTPEGAATKNQFWLGQVRQAKCLRVGMPGSRKRIERPQTNRTSVSDAGETSQEEVGVVLNPDFISRAWFALDEAIGQIVVYESPRFRVKDDFFVQPHRDVDGVAHVEHPIV